MPVNNPHIQNRERLIDSLKAELVGPNPAGEEIDCSREIFFENRYDAFKPWRQQGTGEEILTRDRPGRRYGVGVLYPVGVAIEEGDDEQEDTGNEPADETGEETEKESQKPGVERIELRGEAVEDDAFDFDLSLANSYRPSSMAVSFLARLPENARLVVRVSGGRYIRKMVKAGAPETNATGGQDETREYLWWLRRPVRIITSLSAAELCQPESVSLRPGPAEADNTDGLDLSVEVYSRPTEKPDERLLTVSLVNRSRWERSYDDYSLFQAHFTATVEAPDGGAHICPYPVADRAPGGGEEDEDARLAREEEESLDLLYRNQRTYAVGHGCAADWKKEEGSDFATQVSAESLPVVEVPSTTPDIKRPDGTDLRVSMASLAGLIEDDDGFTALKEVVDLYSDWIDLREAEIPALPAKHQPAARRHVARARRCAERMRDGIAFLQQDEKALKAFRLANHAILIQQVRDFKEPRQVTYDAKAHRLGFSEPYPSVDLLNPGSFKGNWRAFQIAFLLMTLRSTAEGHDPCRENVELIWFPTGGGKTEAYLGLAAFAIFLRYLRNPKDHGVHVLMRYTLRLLTAQQFQRAARLICAMDHLRKQFLPEVNDRISIGIWLGGSTTPNTRKDALSLLRDLSQRKRGVENRFLVTKCPWCGAIMGPVNLKGKGTPNVIGYERTGNTVSLKCSDSACEFHDGLPIYVIDEDIYEQRPDLIIGTVDKFAMLAWRPEARTIFGLNSDGSRFVSPPGLIIQDELHLISGPLGSMVGLYEPLIEALCTERIDPPVRPKIISSTATIRRYEAQIKGLYARDSVTLFPTPGLDSGDSFFARHATDDNGKLLPGRKYVGVHAPGLESFQTVQVRTFSSLLMAPVPFDRAEQDPWWTLLLFYNSLRELGGALSLFQSDIPEYIDGIRQRDGLPGRRFLNDYTILELTGRISGEEVPEAISRLEAPTTGRRRPIDVCLASNIIEVGVDIDRLSLMAVVGQPKTTSQYIQVTGRVGRRWWERPGLVVTLYSASKPRDRSHFEKFRSYHERLYAQVEPTSVTPFSPPALDRALHAVMIAYVRQFGKLGLLPYPLPSDLLSKLKNLLLPRIRRVDPAEETNFVRVFDRRIQQWERWERTEWEARGDNPGLMYVAGDYVPEEHRGVTWPVPMSMRNVDAECVLQIKLPDSE